MSLKYILAIALVLTVCGLHVEAGGGKGGGDGNNSKNPDNSKDKGKKPCPEILIGSEKPSFARTTADCLTEVPKANRVPGSKRWVVQPELKELLAKKDETDKGKGPEKRSATIELKADVNLMDLLAPGLSQELQ